MELKYNVQDNIATLITEAEEPYQFIEDILNEFNISWSRKYKSSMGVMDKKCTYVNKNEVIYLIDINKFYLKYMGFVMYLINNLYLKVYMMELAHPIVMADDVFWET